MKLISAKPSPFGRKVKVMLIETGQMDDIEMALVATTPVNTDPSVAAANPLGKIPALIRNDGPALYDSRVITRYLDDRKQAGMYPDARLWEVLTLEATADEIMTAAVLMTYEKRIRPEDMVYETWLDAQWTKIARAVEAVNSRWMSHLSGPMDISHIGMGVALAYLDFRHGDRDWRTGNDALASWFAEFEQRDSMQATLPE